MWPKVGFFGEKVSQVKPNFDQIIVKLFFIEESEFWIQTECVGEYC